MFILQTYIKSLILPAYFEYNSKNSELNLLRLEFIEKYVTYIVDLCIQNIQVLNTVTIGLKRLAFVILTIQLYIFYPFNNFYFTIEKVYL